MSTFLIVIFALIFLGVPIWVALRAKPLGIFRYRWATFWAIESAILAVASSLSVIPIIKTRGLDLGATLFLVMVILCVLAAAGLSNRVKVGAIFLLASEVLILFLPALVGALYNSPAPASSNGLAIIVLIIVNVFYFRKRWSSMAPGFWPKA